MRIFEWFRTLIYRYKHFEEVEKAFKECQKDWCEQEVKILNLEKAIRVRDYALESLGRPDSPAEEENKPLRTFKPRLSYTQLQRQYEIGNHRQVKDDLAAVAAQRARRQAK